MEMHTQLLWLTTFFCITIENLSVNLSKRNLNAFKLQKGKIEIKKINENDDFKSYLSDKNCNKIILTVIFNISIHISKPVFPPI